MRSKTVQLAGKDYTMKEFTVGQLRTEVIPKLTPLWTVFQGVEKVDEALDKIPEVEETLAGMFPGLTAERFENAYPSEIEAFVEGFIEVNFFGLKRLFGQALSLNRFSMLKS